MACDYGGKKPLKTLCQVGIRSKSCGVLRLLTRYFGVDYGIEIFEYISVIRIMHNNGNNQK
jgi:hypothetical protein